MIAATNRTSGTVRHNPCTRTAQELQQLLHNNTKNARLTKNRRTTEGTKWGQDQTKAQTARHEANKNSTSHGLNNNTITQQTRWAQQPARSNSANCTKSAPAQTAQEKHESTTTRTARQPGQHKTQERTTHHKATNEEMIGIWRIVYISKNSFIFIIIVRIWLHFVSRRFFSDTLGSRTQHALGTAGGTNNKVGFQKDNQQQMT